ncbi:MAG TPA: helix-turn-helix domain-containing protein [Candidatus Tumulicola sp.]|jgi:AraC-like DNA-binding protein
MLLSGEQIVPKVEHGDSALGRWTAAHWQPSPTHALWATVDRLWYFDGTLTLARERVFPDGAIEIVVQLDEPHRDGDLIVPCPFPSVCVNGLRTASGVVVAPAGRCRVAGIRIRAARARDVLGIPAAELGSGTLDLEVVLGPVARDLGGRCYDAVEAGTGESGRAQAAVRASARWILERVAAPFEQSAVTYVAEAILRERGAVSIDSLRAQTGLTRPRLAHRFRQELGVTPKRFARIVRFHQALRSLGNKATPSATAIDLGYFDQAHLYRDFEEFAGMTPGEFLAAMRYEGSASVAEA